MSSNFVSNKVTDYISEGFQRVCDVYHEYADDKLTWQLWNIDEQTLWSDHNSWVYFIVSDGIIMKVGETSQPLGIKSSNCLILGHRQENAEYEYKSIHWYQPVFGTTNRFGRLCNFNESTDTDWYIRSSLYQDTLDGKVSLWAKKCEKIKKLYHAAGKDWTLHATVHKDLELIYIDAVNPPLNKGRK